MLIGSYDTKNLAVEKKPKTVILPQGYLKSLTNHAQPFKSRKEIEEQIREDNKKRIGDSKNRITMMIEKEKQEVSDKLKHQYEKEVQNVLKDIDRESKIENRRNIVLDMAYKKLYEETDRVKYFNAAKMQTDAFKDRDLQAAEKERQAKQKSQYDTDLFLAMLREIDKNKEKEANFLRKTKEDKKVNATNWQQQHEKMILKKGKEKWDYLREGFLARDAAQQETDKATAKAFKIEKDKMKYKSALDRQIEDKRFRFDLHQQLQATEDAKAELFKEAKRDMLEQHKTIKENTNKGKDQKKEYVIQSMTDENIALKLKEETSLQKAILQADAKTREENARKAADQAEAHEAFRRFYEHDMVSKQKKKFDKKVRNFQVQRNTLDTINKLEAIEESKKNKHLELEKEAQHIQLHQIAERQKHRCTEKLQEIKDYMNHIKSLDEEEEIFQKYAQAEIEKYEDLGIDTRAMRKAARPGIEVGKGPMFKNRGHIRPRYYAATGKGEDLTHMKKIFNAADTKSRLGFVAY